MVLATHVQSYKKPQEEGMREVLSSVMNERVGDTVALQRLVLEEGVCEGRVKEQ